LLSPDLAAGVRHVKGAKRLGMRLGNWFTPAQGKQLLGLPDLTSVKGKRNFAMLAVLLGCGLRRGDVRRCQQ
jgi:site-specific recombinase XerD